MKCRCWPSGASSAAALVHPRVDPGPAGLLASGRDAPIAEHRGNARLAQRDAVLRAPVDVLVLAACEDAMSERQAADLRARAVVVGATTGWRRTSRRCCTSGASPSCPTSSAARGARRRWTPSSLPTPVPTPPPCSTTWPRWWRPGGRERGLAARTAPGSGPAHRLHRRAQLSVVLPGDHPAVRLRGQAGMVPAVGVQHPVRVRGPSAQRGRRRPPPRAAGGGAGGRVRHRAVPADARGDGRRARLGLPARRPGQGASRPGAEVPLCRAERPAAGGEPRRRAGGRRHRRDPGRDGVRLRGDRTPPVRVDLLP